MLENGLSPGLQQLCPQGLTRQLHNHQAHLMRVALDRHAVCSPQPQIRNLQTFCLVIYQEILRLQVSAAACAILEAVSPVLLPLHIVCTVITF